MITAALLSWFQSAPSTASDHERAIADWLRTAAVSIDSGAALPPAIAKALEGVRVVGLGEATHGQHESSDLKRKLVMQLVRQHRVRLVGFEASSTAARACDEYVSGRTQDADVAMKGLGILLWQTEENAALLEDLRSWNSTAKPEDRVRFMGVDVQDCVAAANRLAALLEPSDPDRAARAKPLGPRIDAARRGLQSGQTEPFEALAKEVDALRGEIEGARGEIAKRASATDADEAIARVRELSRCMSSARSPAGRDRAMAETLLDELARSGESTRAVVWAHNGHVTNGPLRYMGIEDPGMGGVLREALGEAYYAVGFAFGNGAFHALARHPEKGWVFRRYELKSAPPAESVEAPFVAAGSGTVFVDLRKAPKDGVVAEWLDGQHGQRWFGGGGVPEDVDAATSDVNELPMTVLRGDFDGVVFLPRTTATRPMDAAKVWGETGAGEAPK